MSSTLASKRTILVEAPATLEENYTFDVVLDHTNRPYTVTVPPGGVLKGQRFEIPYPSSEDDDDGASHSSSSSSPSELSNVSGHAADGNRNDNGTQHHHRNHSHDRHHHNRSIDCMEKAVTFRSNSKDEDDDSKTNNNSNNDHLHIRTASSSQDYYDDTEEDDSNHTGAPTGRWRHSFCSCCDVLTQSTFWMALFCVPVLLAQLVTRLGLSWRGTPVANTPLSTMSVTAFGEATEEASLSFNKLVLSFVLVLVVGNFVPGLNAILIALYLLTVLLLTGSNLRRTMRHKYKIPPTYRALCNNANNNARRNNNTNSTNAYTSARMNTSTNDESRCAKVEDCCCLGFCGCCALIQMARHTHDDKEYPGYACTFTGLEVGAPRIV